MSIVELQKLGICKYLISQNCDGLHRRSGIDPSKISELHGNGNIEYCENCSHEYLRDFHAYRIGRGRDHYTGRHCVVPISINNESQSVQSCNGRLLESTIDFGQSLPVLPLQLAEKNSKLSDLHLVLGSSLTVSPANSMPKTTAKRGKPLVIVNLQYTPLDHHATLIIRARCNDVMTGLMSRLKINIPPFTLHRYVKIIVTFPEINSKNSKNDHPHHHHHLRVVAEGIYKGTQGQDIPATIFRYCKAEIKRNKTKTIEKTNQLQGDAFDFVLKSQLKTGDYLKLNFGFRGNYNEEELVIEQLIPIDVVGSKEYRYQVEYNPNTGIWKTLLLSNNNDNNYQEVVSKSIISSKTLTCNNNNLTNNNLNNLNNNEEGDDDYYPENVVWGSLSFVKNNNNKNLIVLTGGVSSCNKSSKDPTIHHGIKIFEPQSQKWHKIQSTQVDSSYSSLQSLIPYVNTARWGHSATVVEQDKIVLIGGWDSTSQYNDVHIYNSSLNSISKLETTSSSNNVLNHRSCHSANVCNNSGTQIVVFGGAVCQGGIYKFFNDVWILDLQNKSWKKIIKDTEVEVEVEVEIEEGVAKAPSGRSQHCAELVEGGKKLCVVGGYNGRQYKMDVWLLDLSKKTWREISGVLNQGPLKTVNIKMDEFRVMPCRGVLSRIAKKKAGDERGKGKGRGKEKEEEEEEEDDEEMKVEELSLVEGEEEELLYGGMDGFWKLNLKTGKWRRIEIMKSKFIGCGCRVSKDQVVIMDEMDDELRLCLVQC